MRYTAEFFDISLNTSFASCFSVAPLCNNKIHILISNSFCKLLCKGKCPFWLWNIQVLRLWKHTFIDCQIAFSASIAFHYWPTTLDNSRFFIIIYELQDYCLLIASKNNSKQASLRSCLSKFLTQLYQSQKEDVCIIKDCNPHLENIILLWKHLYTRNCAVWRT